MTWLEPGIIQLMIEGDDFEVDLEVNIQMHEDVLDMAGRKPFKLLTDGGDSYGNFTKEAREYATNAVEFNTTRIRSAMITKNSADVLLVNSYLRTAGKNVSRSFTDRDEALKWLREDS